MELPRKALLAEFREITRIPNAIKSGRANLNAPIPERFCLGKGHVTFFYDKIGYLAHRYAALYLESVSRGYNVQDKMEAFHNVDADQFGFWFPDDQDRAITVARLEERGHVLLATPTTF